MLVLGLVVVLDVVVLPERIAGRVRFLKKGTVDCVAGVVFGTAVVVLADACLNRGRVRNLT